MTDSRHAGQATDGLAGEVPRLFATGFRMPEKLSPFGTLPRAQLSGFAAAQANYSARRP